MKHQNKLLWQLPDNTRDSAGILQNQHSVCPDRPRDCRKRLAATVYLEMQDSKGVPLGFGSGFFVGDNLIATNTTSSKVPHAAQQNWWVNSALTRSKVSQQRTKRTTSLSKSHDVWYQPPTSRQ